MTKQKEGKLRPKLIHSMTAIMDLSFPGQRTATATLYIPHDSVYVVVNFLFQLIFIFPLFWGMVMYPNEFKTKEKQKLTEIKN